MEQAPDLSDRRELVAHIVKAYVSNNHVPRDELPSLIGVVFDALAQTAQPEPVQPEPEPLVPAVPIKKSITPDFLICLEDGKPFKSLKRHLMTHYDLTPEAYRQKWGLPADYPMVAASYAAKRSELAKSIGLGRKAEAAPAPEADEVETAAPEPAAEVQEETAPEPRRRTRGKAKAAAAEPESSETPEPVDAASEEPAAGKPAGKTRGRRKKAEADA